MVMRLSLIVVAICSALIAKGSSSIYELVGQSSALSMVSLFVPLTAGLYWRKSSNKGAILAMCLGLAIWIYFEFIIESEWPSLVPGLLAILIAMIIGSILLPDNRKKELP